MRVRILSLLICIISLSTSFSAFGQNEDQKYMLDRINEIRAKGCNCQGQFMAPVSALTWNSTLLTSALRHAEDMNRKNYFSHFSPDGNDIGDRIDAVGYQWSYCGENLGSGQRNFEQVLQDWLKSKSHCMMLMNDEMQDVAVAKSGKYWVQHFGKRFEVETLGSN